MPDETNDPLETFRTELGPELDYLTDNLGPAVTGLIERTVEARETKARQEAARTHAAVEHTETVMKAFGESHPDWQTHEAAMLDHAKNLTPNSLSEGEYLEQLYRLATHHVWEAERDAKIAEKKSKDVTPAGNRATTPRDFQQAYEDAKRGVRHQDDDSDSESTSRSSEGGAVQPLSMRDAYLMAKRGERVE